MNILLDTNVLLDMLLARELFVEDARRVFQAKDEGRIVIYVSANSLTDVFYLGRRSRVRDMKGFYRYHYSRVDSHRTAGAT